MKMKPFDKIRNTIIGTVESVSPKEIKVLLDTKAPFSTSLNTGIPQLFPRVNGFLLIPIEGGAIIGMITWIGIEYSPFPKRKGYKDFDIVDLPYPLRKIALLPLGVLKEKGDDEFEVERGISIFPSVGDVVIIPTKRQLEAIVENKDPHAKVLIGTSPLAANAPVYVNPDKLFGRHLAILGNTGSGKSSTISGLIRWSIENAQKEVKDTNKKVNARFIIIDPNGEYKECFNDLGNVKKYAVKMQEEDTNIKQLKVPSWMWNIWEWSSIAQASAKAQRPILIEALKEVKNAEKTREINAENMFKSYVASLKTSLLSYQMRGAELSKWPEKENYGEFLENVKKSLEDRVFTNLSDKLDDFKTTLINKIENIIKDHKKNNNYFFAFSIQEVTCILDIITQYESQVEELRPYHGPDEDTPIFFKYEVFLEHLENLAKLKNQQQYLDFFIMRVRNLLTDVRIASVINTKSAEEITLEGWLNDYIGNREDNPSITILDLSLLPSEILFLTVAVFARIVFEAHHRYKKEYGEVIPTVLVVDEAHNLIKRYASNDEDISSQKLCTQIFEKIAKEGRKFGLGLVLASQRPSELSQTVLSQCNTFILHRIVSERDQEMVKRLVPDAMSNILNEISVLPSRKAIMLGWAVPIPTIIEIKELPDEQRPKSSDPDFWNVWINENPRDINWGEIAKKWQGGDIKSSENDEDIESSEIDEDDINF